jgi:hypothetical protein
MALLAMGFGIPPVPRDAVVQRVDHGHIVLRSSEDHRATMDSVDVELVSSTAAEADSAGLGAMGAAESTLLLPLTLRPTPRNRLRLDERLEPGPPAGEYAAKGQVRGGDFGRLSGSGRSDLRRALAAGKARVALFGLQGEGHRFVYVFDRSISMTGQRLETAKAELIASLRSLESTHQFHIVFFSRAIRTFEFSAGRPAMPFATERNLELAADFVKGIEADGGTDRVAALELAVGMRPDVIFLLTDADGAMSAAEVDAIRRRNDGRATLHVVEFGYGPATDQDNFLRQLARQNSGQYLYLDTSALGW